MSLYVFVEAKDPLVRIDLKVFSCLHLLGLQRSAVMPGVGLLVCAIMPSVLLQVCAAMPSVGLQVHVTMSSVGL